MPFSSASSCTSSILSILGMFGPWMSPSSIPTSKPRIASPTARFTLTVDFPTPPLPDMTTMVCLILESFLMSFMSSDLAVMTLMSPCIVTLRMAVYPQ